jgi:hypothetical protein
MEFAEASEKLATKCSRTATTDQIKELQASGRRVDVTNMRKEEIKQFFETPAQGLGLD